MTYYANHKSHCVHLRKRDIAKAAAIWCKDQTGSGDDFDASIAKACLNYLGTEGLVGVTQQLLDEMATVRQGGRPAGTRGIKPGYGPKSKYAQHFSQRLLLKGYCLLRLISTRLEAKIGRRPSMAITLGIVLRKPVRDPHEWGMKRPTEWMMIALSRQTMTAV